MGITPGQLCEGLKESSRINYMKKVGLQTVYALEEIITLVSQLQKPRLLCAVW